MRRTTFLYLSDSRFSWQSASVQIILAISVLHHFYDQAPLTVHLNRPNASALFQNTSGQILLVNCRS